MSNGSVFVPERLQQAREARGLTLVALADLVNLSSASISHYEKGENKPRPDTLERLARALNVPVTFLQKNDPAEIQSSVFFRSMSAASKAARTRAKRRFEWLKEIVTYIEKYIEFPDVLLPAFDAPSDFRAVTESQIDMLADDLRHLWGLGRGPIADLTQTMESFGLLVTRGRIDSDHIDAFSEYDERLKRPFVFLGADKGIMVRSRFDAAHELFHLIAHRNVDQLTLRKATDFRTIERQAHRFAAALLLPEESFSDELWSLSLDAFRSLKPRWKVSIAAMVSRARQLELIDEAEERRMRINISRRGWRKFEPLDDLEVEQPMFLRRSFELLVSENVATPQQIISELSIPTADVIELAGLDSDFFGGFNGLNEPRLKSDRTDNVVDFSRKR